MEPLNQYSLLATREIEDLEKFVASKNLEVKITGDTARAPKLNSIINALQLPNSCISYLRYHTPVELITREGRPDFCLSIPAEGSFSLHVQGQHIQSCNKIGTLSSPHCDQRIILNEDSSRFCISFTHDTVVNMLESMLGKPLSAPLVFAPGVKLRASMGRSLRSSIHMMVKDTSLEEHSFTNPLVSIQFEQFLISLLLTTQPHNYTKALKFSTLSPASQDVKRVLDYIHGHLHEPILLSELVSVSGVSGRSLFSHFRKFTGKSPLVYITEQRLVMARMDLMNSKPNDTVTTIATYWGFTQLGRFSGLYRKTYGELPRDTLRRSLSGDNLKLVH